MICLARRRCNVIYAMLRDDTYYQAPSHHPDTRASSPRDLTRNIGPPNTDPPRTPLQHRGHRTPGPVMGPAGRNRCQTPGPPGLQSYSMHSNAEANSR